MQSVYYISHNVCGKYNNAALMHYGVKGMKWGIRHDPERKGRKPRALSAYEKSLAASYRKRNKNISKEAAAEEVRRQTRNRRAIAIGAAVLTGAALGYVAYRTHGRMVADNIIKAGHTLQTVHNHPELIQNGEKFYTAADRADKWKYLAAFSQNHDPKVPGEFKKRITMKAASNIRVAGLKTGEKTFNELRKVDPEFAKATAGESWRHFNTYKLLGEPRKETKIYIDKLKSMGYDGIADINDRTGWKTRAHILFGNEKITDIKVHDIVAGDVKKAQVKRIGVETLQAWSSDPWNVVLGGATAGTVGLSYESKRHEKWLQDQKKGKSK